MASIYHAPGAGPWSADDDGIVSDGWLNNGNVIFTPTVDGLTNARGRKHLPGGESVRQGFVLRREDGVNIHVERGTR